MPRTVRELQRWGAKRLAESGAVSAEAAGFESDLLLALSLETNRTALYARSEEELAPEKRQRFAGLINRRAQCEPYAYLAGEREFFSLTFSVDPAVLIPRPETELLVVEAVRELGSRRSERGERRRLFDVGTGSGAIVAAVVHQLGEAAGAVLPIAIDLSGRALEIARSNFSRINPSVGGLFVRADLLTTIDATAIAGSVVVSNPPYIPKNQPLPIDVERYEPALALRAGPTGCEIHLRLIDLICAAVESARSAETTVLLMEIGDDQEGYLDEQLAARRTRGILSWSFLEDLSGRGRAVRILFG